MKKISLITCMLLLSLAASAQANQAAENDTTTTLCKGEVRVVYDSAAEPFPLAVYYLNAATGRYEDMYNGQNSNAVADEIAKRNVATKMTALEAAWLKVFYRYNHCNFLFETKSKNRYYSKLNAYHLKEECDCSNGIEDSESK